MSPLVAQLNTILALGAITMLVASAIIIVTVVRRDPLALLALAQKNALRLTFVLSVVGVVFTLIYSDIFGFVPCGLCWFERIMLYPIAIISGIALWKQDGVKIADYILGLAIPGAALSLYHHYIQMGGAEFVKCPAAGVDCAKRIVFEYGFVTFPLMAFALFVLLAVLMIALRTRPRET